MVKTTAAMYHILVDIFNSISWRNGGPGFADGCLGSQATHRLVPTQGGALSWAQGGWGGRGGWGGTGGWFSSFHRRAGRTMNSLLPLPPDQPSAPQWLPGKVCPRPCVMNLAVLVLYSTISLVLLVLIILDIFPHLRTAMTSFNIFT